jgi:hypothetical protein
MYYLKCNGCAHRNPSRSEFLTFCEQCGKKIDNCFSNWKQKRPEGDFEAFQREVGIYVKDEDLLPKESLKERYIKWAGRRGALVSLILVIAFAAVAGGYFGKKVVISIIYPKINKAWLYSTWETAVIGRQAVEISTPMHLGVSDQPIPADMAQLIEYSKSYRNRSEEGMQVAVNMFSFRPNISNDLELAATNVANKMQQEDDISDLTYTTSHITQSGMDALLLQGTFSYKGSLRLSFYDLLLTRGQHRWEVSIKYRDDDNNANTAALRIIKSIHIK